MKKLVIREAGADDVKAVCSLEQICFKGEDPWSIGAFYNEIVENQGSTLYLVAEVTETASGEENPSSSEIVGYMGLWKILDEGHITNVAVSPEYRRKHIGEQLIEEMIRRTEALGISSWTLEVRVDNEPAIGLYTKMGFRPEGIRKRYYEYDGTDALIMWKGHEE